MKLKQNKNFQSSGILDYADYGAIVTMNLKHFYTLFSLY